MQAHLQARLETLGSQAVLPLTQRQVPAPQGNAPDQGPGLEALLEQHRLHIFQQALRPIRGATLLQQLRVVQLQQGFEQQRAVGTGQAQGFATQGLGDIQLTAQQGLLGQARKAH